MWRSYRRSRTIGSTADLRSIEVETEDDDIVARDEASGIEAEEENVPIALYTLSEKLEMELLQ